MAVVNLETIFELLWRLFLFIGAVLLLVLVFTSHAPETITHTQERHDLRRLNEHICRKTAHSTGAEYEHCRYVGIRAFRRLAP